MRQDWAVLDLVEPEMTVELISKFTRLDEETVKAILETQRLAKARKSGDEESKIANSTASETENNLPPDVVSTS